MKRRNTILSIALIGAITLTSAISLTACKAPEKNATERSRDIYAMSAVSSISYLSDDANALMSSGYGELANSLFASGLTATARPTNIDDADITSIKNCLNTFDSIISGGGIEQSIKENTATDPVVSDYKFEMTINLHDASGSATPYTMYFTEKETTTNTEIDDGKEEIEVNTTFNGIVKFGEEYYAVTGSREVEIEGKETEFSIEFMTFKVDLTQTAPTIPQDFVMVSQSFENDEIEYEYEFYKNGQKVTEIELEYEEERGGVEVSFGIKTAGVRGETEYTVRKGNTLDTFKVTVEKGNQTEIITVTAEADGYNFEYANGYTEKIN